MFLFWVVLSGQFDAFHLTLGVLASAIVTGLSTNLLIGEKIPPGHFAVVARFLVYIPWVLGEIVKSTVHVTYLALHPRMMELIDPKIVTFKTKLSKEISQVALANSITLTPGTITIRVKEGEYYVHALSRKVAQGLPGEMEERIAHVFGDQGGSERL